MRLARPEHNAASDISRPYRLAGDYAQVFGLCVL